MRNVFIGETYDSAAVDTTGLSALEIGFFDGDRATTKMFGSGAFSALSTSLDASPKFLELKRIPARAGVYGAWKVTYSAGSTGSFDEFIIDINSSYSGGDEAFGSNLQSYSVVGLFANAAAVYTAMIAKINADPLAPVVATSSTGVVLTCKEYGQELNVSASYVGTGTVTATYVSTVTAVRPFGYRDDIRELQRLSLNALGNYQHRDRDIPLPALFDDSNSYGSYPFDCLYIGWLNFNQIDGNPSLGQAFSPLNEVYIFMPDGSAELEELQDAIQTFTDGTFTNELSL